VEEQLERTWLQYGLPGGAMIGLLVCILVVFTSQFVTVGAGPRAEDVAHAMWLRAPDLDHVQQILSQNRTITDEEMREIATRQLQNVLEDQRPKQSPQKTWTRQRILVVVPLMILLGCVVTLLACCYPSAVFLWGDEVGRYGTVLQRRRTIWNIIIGMTIIGVVANLFSASLVSWLPPE
jgi:H+/Cl- antiporter ClcA